MNLSTPHPHPPCSLAGFSPEQEGSGLASQVAAPSLTCWHLSYLEEEAGISPQGPRRAACLLEVKKMARMVLVPCSACAVPTHLAAPAAWSPGAVHCELALQE
ncbi:hypothetical protein P7K49_015223, partial [Saguinus oedipus]